MKQKVLRDSEFTALGDKIVTDTTLPWKISVNQKKI